MLVVSKLYTFWRHGEGGPVAIPAGTPFELADIAARDVIARGMAEPFVEETTAPVAGPSQAGSAAGAEAVSSGDLDPVVAAIMQLEPENGEHFTSAGIPRVEALAAVLGRAITAEERDRAWATYQERVAA